MNYIIGIIIVVILYLSFKWSKFKGRIKETEILNDEYSQHARIIEESSKIINQTKNIETGISRFDVIRDNVKRAMEIAPQSAQVSLKVSVNVPEKQDFYITTLSELSRVDEAKKAWIRFFFKEKIYAELQKAKLLSDVKLQTTQLKKALNLALKAFDYLPNDGEVKEMISGIEKLLSALKNGDKKIDIEILPQHQLHE